MRIFNDLSLDVSLLDILYTATLAAMYFRNYEIECVSSETPITLVVEVYFTMLFVLDILFRVQKQFNSNTNRNRNTCVIAFDDVRY